MWKLLLSLVTGPLTSISNDIKEAYQSKLAAQNDAERIAADERINLLEARKSVILAAQSDPIERLVRVGFAFPFVAYTWKLILWDKILALGTTDALSADLTQLMWVVVGGYFVDVTVRGTARILKR
jgi:hypothetical protein